MHGRSAQGSRAVLSMLAEVCGAIHEQALMSGVVGGEGETMECVDS